MKCENCNKEHDGNYGSGRFCGRSCANSRNHSQKTKEKISNSLQKNTQTYCISCNNKTPKSKKKYCFECHKYIQNKLLFDRLDINYTDLSLKEAGHEALQKLWYLYNNLQLSSLEIQEKFNIHELSLRNFFNKHKISMRRKSKAQLICLHNNRRNMPCENKYKHGWHTTWHGKQVFYRSSYELRYAKNLDKQKIPYEMESKRLIYYDTQKKRYSIAIPDFYLPLENKIVEIKCNYTYNKQNMDDKFKMYKNNGYECELIIMKS